MKVGRGFGAGVVAALVAWLVLVVAGSLGLDFRWALLLGSTLTHRVGAGSAVLGFGLHLLGGGLLGAVEAALLERGFRRTDWKHGLVFGIIVAVPLGFGLGLIDLVNPLVPLVLSDPSMFLAGLGWPGVVLFFLDMLLFGAVVGELYSRA